MRRLLVAAVLVAGTAGAAVPASAAPKCHTPKSVGGVAVAVCEPGMECQDLCNWHNPDVRCTYTGAVAQVGTACKTVDNL